MLTDDEETHREKLNHIWDSLVSDSIEYLDTNFDNIAPQLLEFLITSLLNEVRIEIGTFYCGQKKGSNVSYDIYNSDKQLTLHLLPKNVFELELFLYDWDDKKTIYTYKLNETEIKIIPEGLRNLMKEVLKDMEPRTFEVNSIA